MIFKSLKNVKKLNQLNITGPILLSIVAKITGPILLCRNIS